MTLWQKLVEPFCKVEAYRATRMRSSGVGAESYTAYHRYAVKSDSSIRLIAMSYPEFEDTAWGLPPEAPSGDIVKDAIRKEQLLK